MFSTSRSSDHWREEGNGHYRDSQAPDLCPTGRRLRLGTALTCYSRAVHAADLPAGRASAAKNLALASWKMALLLQEMREPRHLVGFYLEDAVRHFSKACAAGQLSKPQEWNQHVAGRYFACLQDNLRAAEALQAEDKVHSLEKTLQAMEDGDAYRADTYLEIGSTLFHMAIVALQGGDYKGALRSLAECYRPTKEAERLAGARGHILDDIRVLEADVFMHRCSAESMQARAVGDALLEVCTKEEEILNMDTVYEVIDWYKQSILLTREIEVEMEAIALSRLGKVYDQVLKQQDKAKENLMRCIQLVHSLHPRTFYSEDWYKGCARTLEGYQRAFLAREEVEHQKQREQYLKQLSKELKGLKAKDEATAGDHLDLLRYVYASHPPKNPAHRLPAAAKLKAMGSGEVKKTLQLGVVHYHPDKQDEEAHGRTWKVLCEEITKVLTQRYERMK